MSDRKRLDILVVEKGIASSREMAKAMIMEGNIYVSGMKEDKPGSSFDKDAVIEYRGERLRYVSRGGLKLEKALKWFDLDLNGLTCMDIGASTGGFTDCMLQNGARSVYAIDVGYGQLAWSLRQDERVCCMEKTNFRYLTHEDISDRPGFASVDVSFISLSKILPAASDILADDGSMVCLIKPQFEAGRNNVGKKGVVRDPVVHAQVIGDCMGYARENGFRFRGLTYSPIKGPEGNIEYLMYITKDNGETEGHGPEDIEAVVRSAHEELDK